MESVAVTKLWAREYVQALARSGKFDCRIWPYHCLIGSAGVSVVSNLLVAFECYRPELGAAATGLRGEGLVLAVQPYMGGVAQLL